MRKILIELRSSLWFVPSLLVLSCLVLALAMVQVDVAFADRLQPGGWLSFLKAGAAGARAMLESIASSMITIAGLAFSITIVTLSLASSQYTPRILRNFMRDRANQTVLGVFLGIYVYCLIVLRSITDGHDGSNFVPIVAVSVGLLLALVGIGFLIFFIHHIAASIQASSILDAITRETIVAVDRLFPQEIGEPAENVPAVVEGNEPTAWHAVPAPATGYIQSVEGETLFAFARERDLVVRLERAIGDFVSEGEAILSTSTELSPPENALAARLIVIGNFRTVDQDVDFGLRQIVDIALKALSPGINGTTTAVSCLNYMGAILSHLAQRPMASPYRAREGRVRIVAPAPRFGDFVAKALDEIRLCASNNVTIFLSMLELLARVARATDDPQRRAVLLLHAGLIATLADTSIPEPYDRARVNHLIRDVRDALGDHADLPLLSCGP